MNQIGIYTEKLHPRLAYVMRFIQGFNPENEWICLNTLNEYHSFNGISINYSKSRIKEQELFVYFSGWLIADKNAYLNVPVRNTEERFQIFPNEDDDRFDVFAAIFYVIAKIEEYLPFEEDEHLRFPACQSILYKNKVLSIPIVDFWVIQLIQYLESAFEVKIIIEKRNPSWSLGIDVDQFFKYKHKNLFKKTGGLIRSLFTGEFKEFNYRIQVLFFNHKDPYDSYDQIQQLNIDKEQLFFFILGGGESKFDKNHSLQLIVIQNILKRLARFSIIGLHPSYASANSFSKIDLEKKKLEKSLGYKVELSRQHFLKIRFPESYLQLIAQGIKKDYSLGYADHPGFRAGTCRNFYWYDLKHEMETDLLLIPIIAMDRSYLDYLRYGPEASKTAVQKLFETCIAVGGHFHLVWHNSSYDFEGEWKSWEGVLESLIQYFKLHEHQKVPLHEIE